MCRKLVVTNKLSLGSRELGWETYSLPKGEVVEDDCLANLFYIVLGTRKAKQETVYDVVSSRYERTSFGEKKVKALLEMGIISGGAKLENGKAVIAPLTKEKTADKVESVA